MGGSPSFDKRNKNKRRGRPTSLASPGEIADSNNKNFEPV
jgi:hypothetical protein